MGDSSILYGILGVRSPQPLPVLPAHRILSLKRKSPPSMKWFPPSLERSAIRRRGPRKRARICRRSMMLTPRFPAHLGLVHIQLSPRFRLPGNYEIWERHTLYRVPGPEHAPPAAATRPIAPSAAWDVSVSMGYNPKSFSTPTGVERGCLRSSGPCDGSEPDRWR